MRLYAPNTPLCKILPAEADGSVHEHRRALAQRAASCGCAECLAELRRQVRGEYTDRELAQRAHEQANRAMIVGALALIVLAILVGFGEVGL